MHSERKQCSCRRGESRTPPRSFECPHEEIGGERTRECEQRVHPSERPVDQQELRRRGEDRRNEAGGLAGEPTREVVAERDRGEREHDRNPAQHLGRRIERQGDVREQEVERRAAAIEHDRVQQVPERARGDQAGDRFILMEGLAADIRTKARKEQAHRSRQQQGGNECGRTQHVTFDRGGAHR